MSSDLASKYVGYDSRLVDNDRVPKKRPEQDVKRLTVS